MRRSSSPPLDPAVAGRRPFGDGAGSELRRQTGSRRTTTTATMDFEVRDLGLRKSITGYHLVLFRSSPPRLPEMATALCSLGALVGTGQWRPETEWWGLGRERQRREERQRAEPRRGGERTARVGSHEPATPRFSRWSSDGCWSGVRMSIMI